MKIAFDENVPNALVKAFQLFSNERAFKSKGDFEIQSALDYTPKLHDKDYLPKNDVPWIKRFSDSDGRVIITGDTAMSVKPHERLALIEAGMIVIFFEPKWNKWKFFDKCALLMHWWPILAYKVKFAEKGLSGKFR